MSRAAEKAVILIILPLLVITTIPLITVTSNTTENVLLCRAAEDFIRTHMAPDFETPRLVRRLDWFFDEALVASYQQDVLADSSRQWWVADGRYQLQKPFYALRIAPVAAEDSGIYKCRLETDPLFSADQDTDEMELSVMVKPVPPSSPEVKGFSNRSITLVWNHSSARAHKPILRYSVSVRTITDGTRFVMAAPSNSTTVIVENLEPFTLYGLSVRAENAAGNSEFGPEINFRTRGDAPKFPPKIVSITNVTAKCVEMILEPPQDMHGDLSSYIVLSQLSNGTNARRVVYDNPTSSPLTLCDLTPSSVYSINIEADNGFGRSPFASATFSTEPDIPNLSPDTVTAVSIVGKPEITVLWSAPGSPTDAITKYHLYYKTLAESVWRTEHLNVGKVRPKMYRYRLVGLEPSTTYQMMVSASTAKGEGQKSATSSAQTDVQAPSKVTLKSVTFDCKNGVTISWDYPESGTTEMFTTKVWNQTSSLIFNTTQHKLDVIDLALKEEYQVQIVPMVVSHVDNKTVIGGEWSQAHRFLLEDNCQMQSSVCGEQEKCMKMVMLTANATTAVTKKNFSIVIVVFAVVLFAIICIVIAHLAKGTANLKRILKKKKEKCVYLEEISPLVYDSVGYEEIPVELFYGYVEDLKKYDNTKFRAQFDKIESLTGDQTDGTESEHSGKNRYMNIGSVEATRIRLNTASGNDYINANFIDSCNEKNAYIATQAPLPSTFDDFWQMTWQEKGNIIVCITNMVEDGKRKCDQYWPEKLDYAQTYGNYTVKKASEMTNAYFVHRIFTIRIAKAVPIVERKIHHLHFTGWPDHGVPASVFPLLNFVHYVSDIHSTGPVIVHCSAGVGRSGSFILVDSIRRHLISHRRLNVLGHLVHMRRQREKLVQTMEQYVFCHESIRQLIRHGITRVHTDLFMRYMNYLSEENAQGKTRLQIQYEDICQCRHQPRCQLSSEFLLLPGYHRLNEYIVGMWPTETEDLWRLVWKQNVQNIVIIEDPKAETFWKKLTKVDTVTVQHTESMVLLQSSETQMCVRIISVSKTNIHHDFWREIENIQKQRLASHDAPLLVLCPAQQIGISSQGIPTIDSSEGSTLSMSMLGQQTNDETCLAFTVCALTTLACQLESTGCVDVVQVLAGYSQSQCGIFTSKQDVEIIYEKISQLVGGTRV